MHIVYKQNQIGYNDYSTREGFKTKDKSQVQLFPIEQLNANYWKV